MSFRTTIVLALLCAALGSFLWFVERGKIEEETRGRTLLPGVTREDVTGFALEYPGRRIVLRKTPAGWRLEEPVAAEADPAAVESLFRALAKAEVERTLPDDLGAPESYGLDPPRVVVRVALGGSRTAAAIEIGKTVPVGHSVFARVAGETAVRIVPSVFAGAMEKQPKDFRRKEIVDPDEARIRRIAIEAPGESDFPFELRRGDAGWEITRPRKLPADDAAVRSFLSSLRSIRAEDFHDDVTDPGRFGLEEPRRRITLHRNEDEPPLELWVGAERERDGRAELYVKRADGDTVYAVGTYAWTNLGKRLNTFRDKTVLAFDRDALGSLVVSRPDDDPLRVVRKEDGWTIAGSAKRLDEEHVTRLVRDLERLRGYYVAAENPADLSRYGLADPTLTFSLVDRNEAPIGRIRVSRIDAGETETVVYAMAEGSDLVFRLHGHLYEDLDRGARSLTDESQENRGE